MHHSFVAAKLGLRGLFAFLIATAALWPMQANAQAPPVLNPKEYQSPSGAYCLKVDPSNMYGSGKATYRLTHNGKEVWSGERPFTLWEAGVTEDGTVGGYAYSNGPPAQSDPGEFRVVLLDSHGTVRLEQVTKREGSRFFHASGNPLAAGLIVDRANDRLVVRVHDADVNREIESWWVFRLSTAKAEGKIEPKSLMADPEPVRFIIDARVVAGTPLTLLHWWRSGPNQDLGARFTLIDLKGNPIWMLDLPKDYTRNDDENAQDQLMNEIRKTGAILRADQPGRFDLRFVAEAKRVTFAVERGPDGAWKVHEIGRLPYVPAAKSKERSLPVPEKPLRYLGAVTLRAPAQKPPGAIRDILEFVIDGKGRLAFLRREPDTAVLSFVLVEPTGTVVREIRLDALEYKKDTYYRTLLTWIGGDRFLLTRSLSSVEAKASVWWVDVVSGKIAAITGFNCPAIDKVAGFPDGRFVVLATNHWKYTSSTTAYLFDAHGRLAKEFAHDDNGKPGTLFNPTDIAVTSDGKIAVLDVIRNNVSLFEDSGKYLRTIDLAKEWKRKPNYPSYLAADASGGLLVGDFQGSPPIIRMKADGALREELTAKFSDGRTSPALQNVRVAADGHLWTTDGSALLRLDSKGVVDRVLGDPPDPSQLGVIAAVNVDQKGRIYAVSARTAAVHVFDSAGRHLYVCRPEPTDFRGLINLYEVSVAETGEVYLTEPDGPRGVLRFSPEGKRLGFERFGLDPIREQWHFQPGGKCRWILGLDKIWLVEGKNAILRTIERRPDGRWLQYLAGGAVGRDGSLAVMDAPGHGSESAGSLNIYTNTGKPVRNIPVRSDMSVSAPVAYDGELLAISDGPGILLYDRSGRPVQRFKPREGGDETVWQPFLIAKARQLWLSDGRVTVQRYALP
jgi:sugar lactone lactonase YvrE